MPAIGAFQVSETVEFVIELFVSVGIGILIGLEREHSRADDRGKDVVAGVRTFPLISMSGFIITYLAIRHDIPYLVPVGIVVFGFVSVVFFYVRYHNEMKGMTTSLAIFVTFLIGVLVGFGYIFFGLVVGIITTFLLASKHRLHDIALVLDEDELLGALEFAVLALILLPLTYQLMLAPPYGDYIGPGKPFDVFWILLIVTIVSLISLFSFIAIRRFGSLRGLEFSGAMGGLINSEAATASLAGIARKNPGVANPVLIGILLSNALMLLRNLAICAISDPSLKVLKLMLLPCLLMVLSCVAFTRNFKGGCDAGEKIEMKNPFAILPALKFAMIFAIIAAIAYGATNFPAVLGNRVAGDVAVGFTALGGLVSSAAVVAPLSSLSFGGHITVELASIVATAACIVSTVNKALLVRLCCTRGLTRRIALPCAVTAVIGAVSLIVSCLIFF
jgi:uncharacterized membrane protein (DUF4010 family)